MKYCTKCGAELSDEVKFCPLCGQPSEVKTVNSNKTDKKAEYQKKIEDAVTDFVNTKDETAEFDIEDINKNKIWAVLLYLHIVLLIVALVMSSQSKFVKYHANQGLNLFLSSLVVGVVGAIIPTIAVAISDVLGVLFAGVFVIICIAICVLMVIGVINAAQGKAKELPIIGGFRFIK